MSHHRAAVPLPEFQSRGTQVNDLHDELAGLFDEHDRIRIVVGRHRRRDLIDTHHFKEVLRFKHEFRVDHQRRANRVGDRLTVPRTSRANTQKASEGHSKEAPESPGRRCPHGSQPTCQGHLVAWTSPKHASRDHNTTPLVILAHERRLGTVPHMSKSEQNLDCKTPAPAAVLDVCFVVLSLGGTIAVSASETSFEEFCRDLEDRATTSGEEWSTFRDRVRLTEEDFRTVDDLRDAYDLNVENWGRSLGWRVLSPAIHKGGKHKFMRRLALARF